MSDPERGTEIRIRPRTDSDLPELLVVLSACAADSGYFADEAGNLISQAAELIAGPGFRQSWVAEDESGLLGQISLLPLPLSDDEPYFPFWFAATGAPAEKHVLVKRLFVHPRAQGRGVAKGLMGAAMADLAAAGLIGVLDTASIAEPAMALYQGLGWREVGRTKPTWSADPFEAVLFVQAGL